MDGASVALARGNVAAAGLDKRVAIHCRDVTDPTLAGRYDLVTVFECVHAMPQPVAVLRAMRGLVTEGFRWRFYRLVP